MGTGWFIAKHAVDEQGPHLLSWQGMSANFCPFLLHSWNITLEMAPWLLLGMLMAGALHVLLPAGYIQRHLGKSKFSDVLKAVAIGVPMPLCSCGVIPAALGLKKEGASNGASLGFLISTPQTGVDSILVSATFLGWPFAIFKVISALVSGLLGGMLVNVLDQRQVEEPQAIAAPCCHTSDRQQKSVRDDRTSLAVGDKAKRSWKTIFTFGFTELLHDIYRWLLIGIIIAALIATLVPAGTLQGHRWSQGGAGLMAVLVISLPMYICATASVPLAAALVAAGLSPGAALVLLMAGPTTNVATVGMIYRTFGLTLVMIYLGTVSLLSIASGFTFDRLLAPIPQVRESWHGLPPGLEVVCVATLLALIGWLAFGDIRQRLRPTGPKPCCSDRQSPRIPPRSH